MKDTIILGGSFNPPTIAHLHIMRELMTQTEAPCGIFVPSSDAYVTRKARGTGTPYVLSGLNRIDMLDNMCVDKNRSMTHSDIEIEMKGPATGHTYQTMCLLRDYYGTSDLCFAVGSDKLGILPRWKNIEKFLSEFRILVMPRFGETKDYIQSWIKADKKLGPYADSFIVVTPVKSMPEVSSSKFWEYYQAKDRRMLDIVTEYTALNAVRELHNNWTMTLDGFFNGK